LRLKGFETAVVFERIGCEDPATVGRVEGVPEVSLIDPVEELREAGTGGPGTRSRGGEVAKSR